VTVTGAAAVGPRDVTVTLPGGGASATCAGCLTVDPRPTVSTISPAALAQGVAHATVTVTGTGFLPGATVAFGGTGITVNSVSTTGTTLTLDVTVAPTAATGGRTITVTNVDGGTVARAGLFIVRAAFTVTSVQPGGRAQGTTTIVVITGSGFPANVATAGAVSFGAGTTVTSLVRNSATRLTVTLAIAAAAAPGLRDVVVSAPGLGAAMCAGCFTVTAAPTISRPSSPIALVVGSTHRLVTITGSGFQSGIVAGTSGGRVTVNSVTLVDATSLVLDITVNANAIPGARDISVTNVDGGSATCTGCLVLNALPVVQRVTPGIAARGTTVTVTVSGRGFQAGALVTFSGSGVTGSVIAVNAAGSSITVRVSVAANASVGSRNLAVTNPDGGSTTAQGALRII
jgi:hypothetical protein